MLVVTKSTYAEMSEEAARIVARQVLANPKSCLGFPTGRTPVGMYRELVRLCRERLLDVKGITVFALDEYYGLSRLHPQSYCRYMKEHFTDYVDVQDDHVHCLDGAADDAKKECRGYESAIASQGGIDLLVLGLGRNGHIAFNEPGTGWETTTRLVRLSEATREQAVQDVGRQEDVPTGALTMGIKTLMNAKRLALLVSGKEKASIVREALEGSVTTDTPASILQLHPEVTVILDKAAASYLS